MAAADMLEPYLVALFLFRSPGMVLAQPYLLEKATIPEKSTREDSGIGTGIMLLNKLALFTIYFFQLPGKVFKRQGHLVFGIRCISFNEDIALIVGLTQCSKVRFEVFTPNSR